MKTKQGGVRGSKHSGKRKQPLRRPAGGKEQGLREQQEYHAARGEQGREWTRPDLRGGVGGGRGEGRRRHRRLCRPRYREEEGFTVSAVENHWRVLASRLRCCDLFLKNRFGGWVERKLGGQSGGSCKSKGKDGGMLDPNGSNRERRK